MIDETISAIEGDTSMKNKPAAKKSSLTNKASKKASVVKKITMLLAALFLVMVGGHVPVHAYSHAFAHTSTLAPASNPIDNLDNRDETEDTAGVTWDEIDEMSRNSPNSLTPTQGLMLWMFAIVAFLKLAQKMDGLLQSLGLNVTQTGGRAVGDLIMAGMALKHVGGAISKGMGMFGFGRGGSPGGGSGGSGSGTGSSGSGSSGGTRGAGTSPAPIPSGSPGGSPSSGGSSPVSAGSGSSASGSRSSAPPVGTPSGASAPSSASPSSAPPATSSSPISSTPMPTGFVPTSSVNDLLIHPATSNSTTSGSATSNSATSDTSTVSENLSGFEDARSPVGKAADWMKQDGFAQGAVKSAAKGGIVGAGVYTAKAGVAKIREAVSSGSPVVDGLADSRGSHDSPASAVGSYQHNQADRPYIDAGIGEGSHDGFITYENPESFRDSRPLGEEAVHTHSPLTANNDEHPHNGDSAFGGLGGWNDVQPVEGANVDAPISSTVNEAGWQDVSSSDNPAVSSDPEIYGISPTQHYNAAQISSRSLSGDSGGATPKPPELQSVNPVMAHDDAKQIGVTHGSSDSSGSSSVSNHNTAVIPQQSSITAHESRDDSRPQIYSDNVNQSANTSNSTPIVAESATDRNIGEHTHVSANKANATSPVSSQTEQSNRPTTKGRTKSAPRSRN